MALAPLLTRLARPLRAVLDYALPPRCAGCGAIVGEDHVFCLPCWRALDFLGGLALPPVRGAAGRCLA